MQEKNLKSQVLFYLLYKKAVDMTFEIFICGGGVAADAGVLLKSQLLLYLLYEKAYEKAGGMTLANFYLRRRNHDGCKYSRWRRRV